MEKQRVLLLSAQSLLGESLQLMLSHEENIELIGPWQPGDQSAARIAEAGPDVILVVEEEAAGSTTATITTRILTQYPSIPLLRVGLACDVIRLHTSATLPARSSDLIGAIRNLPRQEIGL